MRVLHASLILYVKLRRIYMPMYRQVCRECFNQIEYYKNKFFSGDGRIVTKFIPATDFGEYSIGPRSCVSHGSSRYVSRPRNGCDSAETPENLRKKRKPNTDTEGAIKAAEALNSLVYSIRRWRDIP